MDDDRSSSWFLRYNETIHRDESTSPFIGRTHLLRFIKGSYGIETCSVVMSHMYTKISVYSFLDKSYKLFVDLKHKLFCTKAHRQAPKLKMYEFIECLAVVYVRFVVMRLGSDLARISCIGVRVHVHQHHS